VLVVLEEVVREQHLALELLELLIQEVAVVLEVQVKELKVAQA
jgi:hypothetical protein